MGIVKAFFSSVDGMLAEQWKEIFVCNSLSGDLLMVRGEKVSTDRGSNTKSDPNVITDGSLIVLADGQAAVVVEGGQVECVCTAPGENVFHSESTPSLFNPGGLKGMGSRLWERISFGGDVPITQRIYFVNTKECPGNVFASQAPISFRAKDPGTGLDMDINLSCRGFYSFRVCDPGIFYKTITGNLAGNYTVGPLSALLQTEILTVLQTLLAQSCAGGLRPFQIPAMAEEISSRLKEALSRKWGPLRGLEAVSLGLDMLALEDADGSVIRGFQRDAVLKDPAAAAAHLTAAQADAMTLAAANPGGGSGLAGFRAAAGGQPAPWKCSCGASATGNFCTECGRPRPRLWGCACGAMNTGNFCEKCGRPKP